MAADRLCTNCGESHGPLQANVIVTVRVADIDGPPRPGAVEKACAVCDEPVWIAPATFAFFAGVELPPIWCAQCAVMMTTARGRA